MMPFTTLTGIVAPLLAENVDTDSIIPSREIRSTGRTGLAEGLFAHWRYLDKRTPNPDFILNKSEFSQAPILAAGSNFGCGSSREHAVWALAEYGVRAVIAPSFAPIFVGNCIRNGLLPVVLEPAAVEAVAGKEVTIDLGAQMVTCGDSSWPFAIEQEAREMLLQGLDAIDLTLKAEPAIQGWLERDRAARPWVYLGRSA